MRGEHGHRSASNRLRIASRFGVTNPAAAGGDGGVEGGGAGGGIDAIGLGDPMQPAVPSITVDISQTMPR